MGLTVLLGRVAVAHPPTQFMLLVMATNALLLVKNVPAGKANLSGSDQQLFQRLGRGISRMKVWRTSPVMLTKTEGMAYNAHKQTLIPRGQGEDLQILGATTKLQRNPNLGFSF